MSDINKNKRPKVATVNIKNVGPVDIVYIGGSMFELAFPNQTNSKPIRFAKNVLDNLIKTDQVAITSQSTYNKISSEILPDGSTKTHNADGTLKSSSSKVLETLVEDGYITQDESGNMSVASKANPTKKEKKKRPANIETEQDESKDIDIPDEEQEGDTLSDNNEYQVTANKKDDDLFDFAEEQYASEEDDEEESLFIEVANKDGKVVKLPDIKSPISGESISRYNEDEVLPEISSGITRRKRKRKKEEAELLDINCDGVIDEIDHLVAQEQKRNLGVMVMLFSTLILSVMLFFFGHVLAATLLTGQPVSFLPDFSGKQNSVNNQQENIDSSSINQNSSDIVAVYETVKRTDFDPETAVANYPMADEEQQYIAIAVMQAIRECIINGDVNKFNLAVDLDNIATQLSKAYADAASQKQFLSEAEKAETQDAWWWGFTQTERQHVVDRDTYGSIFGGRIREVRQDTNIKNRLYVVMESIAGDHQRICFVISQDAAENWSITEILDAPGYIKMIQTGKIEESNYSQSSSSAPQQNAFAQDQNSVDENKSFNSQ